MTHRRALRDSLPSLAILVASATAVAVALLHYDGSYIGSDEMSTARPPLLVAAVLALSAQGAAVIVRYRQYVRSARVPALGR